MRTEARRFAERLIRETKKFTDKETKLITSAIYQHSDKHIVSKNPYIELVKDADVFLTAASIMAFTMPMSTKNSRQSVGSALTGLKCVEN